ncbi:MAG: hypothetical protein GWN00_35995, partial [Aliifodinibius sp.]|nr:hypothetical protein [Fodinibius sp.]NIV16042.1 hypothetical protein [Fodinibius sp.]NIY29996.1 hypothetical protein [Fodinibius sp.]
TRLTIEAARELAKEGFFKDGIYFVSLAAITDGDSLLMSLADQLDVSIYSRSSLQLIVKSYLVEQDVLLVLDNFEQLTAESDLISQLLEETQHLKFLISSREALNIRAEQRLI